MSDWNNGGASPYDPRYVMYTNGQYYQAVPGTEFGSGLQPSVRSSEVGYAPPSHSHRGYGQEQRMPAPYVTSQPQPLQTYSQTQIAAGQTGGIPMHPGTNAYGHGYATPDPNIVGSPHRNYGTNQDRDRREEEQQAWKGPTSYKNAQPYGTSAMKNETIHNGRGSGSQAPAKGSSILIAQAPHNRSSGHTTPAMASSTQTQPMTSGSASKELGTVFYNDEAQEYRYKCDREECSGKTMGRVQDLKRHFDDFHGGLLLACPVAGCTHSKTRKDKLMKHCREAHMIEYTYG